MREENYRALADAIILRAAKDYTTTYRRLRKHPYDGQAKDSVREITDFFCSQYFEALTELDGPALLHEMMREIDEKK